MPPKERQDFDLIFLQFTLAVEKKIIRLMTYKESLEDVDNFSELQCKILMTHANTLLGNMEHMEVQCDSLQNGIPQDDYDRINPIPTSKKSYIKDLPWAESAHV